MLTKLSKLSGIASGVIITILGLWLTTFFNPITEGIENLWKHEPAVTKFTKVIDGNNQTVLSNGKTFSSDITFFFEAYDNGKMISNELQFECKLDSRELQGEQFTECNRGNSQNYADLPNGHYTFFVKVKDTNAKRTPEPAMFSFIVLPSYTILGTIIQNTSNISNAIIVMDNNNNFKATTDSFGNFYISSVNFLTKENNIHNFTIHIKNKQGEEVKCETQRNLEFGDKNKVSLGKINLDDIECSNSLDTLSLSSSIGNIYNDLKLEKYDTHASKKSLFTTELDLLYNTTLVKKPTSNFSRDGIWNVVIYLDGLDLDKVSNVTYYIHNDIITMDSVTHPKFAVHFSAYKGFKFFAKVVLKDGGILDFSRYLLLDF
jgi:hypothetical protein